MKKADYYINVTNGREDREYPRVSGYVENVIDSKGNSLTIGYDKRYDDCWRATELNTGFLVSRGEVATKEECVEQVHSNIDVIVEIYNKKMTDEKYYNDYIKPFRDFVEAN